MACYPAREAEGFHFLLLASQNTEIPSAAARLYDQTLDEGDKVFT
jgi:hypothetical protein